MSIQRNILELDTSSITTWNVDKFLELYQEQGIAIIDNKPSYPTRAYDNWAQQYKYCAYCGNHCGGEDDCKGCGARTFNYKEKR